MFHNFLHIFSFSERSCWLELSELCIVDKVPIPTWNEIVDSRNFCTEFSQTNSDSFFNCGRIMYVNFLIHIYLEKHQGEQAMQVCYCGVLINMLIYDFNMQAIESIVNVFPTSSILFTQVLFVTLLFTSLNVGYTKVGLSHYSLRNYDKAQESFELLRERDPYRLTHIDTYSNILYVKEKQAELSHLAHVVVKVPYNSL